MEISEEQIASFFLIVAIIATGYLIYSLLHNEDNIKESLATLGFKIHVLENQVKNVSQTRKICTEKEEDNFRDISYSEQEKPRYEYRWIGPPGNAYIYDYEQNEGMSLSDICILLNEYEEHKKREHKDKN